MFENNRKLSINYLLSLAISTFCCPMAQAQTNQQESQGQLTITSPCEVRALPGGLDQVLMLNSNSPEIVGKEGILVSTFPKEGKKIPSAHLDYPLAGRFNLFAHHINTVENADEPRTLFIAALFKNPGNKKVKIKILRAASYVSQPDAPFITLPDMVENPEGNIYAGPGDRVMTDMLCGKRQSGWPKAIIIRPGQSKLLFNLPVGVKPFKKSANGRSALLHLKSNGPVYAATVALFAPKEEGQERAPTVSEVESLLSTGDLAVPRDKVPTVPGAGEV